MGKNFEKEIKNLDIIYKSALKCDCSIITDFIKQYRNTTFLLVGSGGSYSVASAMEMFCMRIGVIAKCVTPLELSQYEMQIKNCAVVIFSAGGKNSDSLNAYKYASEMEAKGILSICMCLNSKLKSLQHYNTHNYFFEYDMPIHKDGYLAVESLISSIVILSKSFYEITGDSFFLQKKCSISAIADQSINNFSNNSTILVLYCGITKPIAIDMESKFGEASISNIQILDLRNFAHGRHFWLADRSLETSVVVLEDKSFSKLIESTLKLIPQDIPILKYTMQDNNIDNLLVAYEFMFNLVNSFSLCRGVDPGRPKIPEFGRKLYHISYNYSNNQFLKTARKDPVIRGIYRKFGIQDIFNNFYYEYGKKYYDKIINHHFRGILFDYDGTLCLKKNLNETENKIFAILNKLLENNIPIGIATGRGKSVRIELQSKIEKKYWNQVCISYYNGSCSGLLCDNEIPNKSEKTISKTFLSLINRLNSLSDRFEIVKEDNINPYQITIVGDAIYWCRDLICDTLHSYNDIKYFYSDHSMDIISIESSKKNAFYQSSFANLDPNDILKIGDSGHVLGNDFELLNVSNSISVDSCSKDLDSCWNFSELGLRNLEATLSILEQIAILDNGIFTIKE
jgi:hydroxymethylpyrimidine pyrophosphatase-like HAD family hydrolase